MSRKLEPKLSGEAKEMLRERDGPVRIVSLVCDNSKLSFSTLHWLVHSDCNCEFDAAEEASLFKPESIAYWYRRHFPTATGYTKDGGDICFTRLPQDSKSFSAFIPYFCVSQVIILFPTASGRILSEAAKIAAVINTVVWPDKPQDFKFGTLIVLADSLTQPECNAIFEAEPQERSSKATPNSDMNLIRKSFEYVHVISLLSGEETTTQSDEIPLEHVVDLIFASSADTLSWKDFKLTGTRLSRFLEISSAENTNKFNLKRLIEDCIKAELQPILSEIDEKISSETETIKTLLPMDTHILKKKLQKIPSVNHDYMLQCFKDFCTHYTSTQWETACDHLSEINQQKNESVIKKAISDLKAKMSLPRDSADEQLWFEESVAKLKKQLKNLGSGNGLHKELAELQRDFDTQFQAEKTKRKSKTPEVESLVEVVSLDISTNGQKSPDGQCPKLLNYNEFRSAYTKRFGSTTREGQSLAWTEYKKSGGKSINFQKC